VKLIPHSHFTAMSHATKERLCVYYMEMVFHFSVSGLTVSGALMGGGVVRVSVSVNRHRHRDLVFACQITLGKLD